MSPLAHPIPATEQYTPEPGEALKNTIIEYVFPTFAQGFILHAQQKGHLPRDLRLLDEHASSLPLQPVYNAALTFLYRLLFLLYAEGRDLLSMCDGHGSDRLARLIHDSTTCDEPGNASTLLYDRFQDLFRTLNGGDTHIPLYSDDLFLTDPPPDNSQEDVSSVPAVARFLIESKFPDCTLASGLTKLTHIEDPVTHNLMPIDYKNLPVRLLGNIYESLQAFSLRVAVEKMVVVKGRRTDDLITYQEALATHRLGRVKREYAPGAAYFVRDHRARRSTGSYYTPDCIVQYILEHTLGPVLEMKFASLEDRFSSQHKACGAMYDALQESDLIAAFFNIKILDPAMGSGHFLVAAVNYIAARMMVFLFRFPRNPVLAELTSMRATLRKENAAFNAPSDIDLLKRVVVKRCIFGVDLDPMAVEIAKMSLCLDSFVAGAPFPFLDSHVRCGNALIGARLQDIRAQDAQLLQCDAPINTARASIIDVSKCSDLTPDQARECEEKFSLALKQLAPAKDALDRYLRRWFGNSVQAYRTFHWDLEFPEVFIAAPGEYAGFDAIIGNPPYINANELNKSLSAREKPYWKAHFASAAGAYDIYLLFMELALRLSREQGYWAFITPNKFLSAPYASAFRTYYSRAAKMLRLLDASRADVFADPSVYPVVLVSQAYTSPPAYTIETERLLGAEGGKPPPYCTGSVTVKRLTLHRNEHLDMLPEKLWSYLLSAGLLPLLLKAQRVSLQLQQCALVRASTSASEADAFATALSNEHTGASKKFINTGLIDRYDTSWGMEPLTHKGRSFPTPYLDISKGVVSNARRAQYQEPKLIIAKMARNIEAFLDEEGAFASANTNFISSSIYDLKFLLALLNSSLLSTIYAGYFGALTMSGGYIQYQAPQLRVLPIRRVNFVTPAPERNLSLEEVQCYYQRYLDTDDPGIVLAFVRHHLSLRPEQSDVVHDLLAFLAETMQHLNREMRAMQRSFFEERRDLEHRLALTDKLIDAVVYQLYDLSP